MTQIFKEDGERVPVTLIKAGPCLITQIKQGQAPALQVGLIEERTVKNLNKPQVGHLKGMSSVDIKELRDFAMSKEEVDKVKRGDKIVLTNFKTGDLVEVTGISKGKGFQGVVKRHGFAGGPASHGHKDNLRMPGAIGAGGVQRVFKGTRMAGRMGGEQVTIKNLEVAAVDVEAGVLKIKGALPGARHGLLIIQGPGELSVEKKAEPMAEESTATAKF